MLSLRARVLGLSGYGEPNVHFPVFVDREYRYRPGTLGRTTCITKFLKKMQSYGYRHGR